MILKGDARELPLEDESVACIVTSPPYNVGVEYEGYKDAIDWNEYYLFAQDSAREMSRVLVPGGRLWLNVMPTVPIEGAATRMPLQQLWMDAIDDLHSALEYRDTVVWVQDSFDGACGWGSWKRPSAPNLRGGYEVILSYFKPPYKRTAPEGYEKWTDDFADDVNEESRWQDLCRNVWTMRPQRRRAGAPAPFPPELPARCIRLSTWPGETVLDPFVGSGTTVEVAEALGRIGIGVDVDALEGGDGA